MSDPRILTEDDEGNERDIPVRVNDSLIVMHSQEEWDRFCNGTLAEEDED